MSISNRTFLQNVVRILILAVLSSSPGFEATKALADDDVLPTEKVTAVAGGVAYECLFDSQVTATLRGWFADGTTACDKPVSHLGITLRYTTPTVLEDSRGCWSDDGPCTLVRHSLELECGQIDCSETVTVTMTNRHKITFSDQISLWNGPDDCWQPNADPYSIECTTKPEAKRSPTVPSSNRVTATAGGVTFNCAFDSHVVATNRGWSAYGQNHCDKTVSSLGVTLKYTTPTVKEGSNACNSSCQAVAHWLEVDCTEVDCATSLDATMENLHLFTFPAAVTFWDGIDCMPHDDDGDISEFDSILCLTDPETSRDATLRPPPAEFRVTAVVGSTTFTCLFGSEVIPTRFGWSAKGNVSCDKSVDHLGVSLRYLEPKLWNGDEKEGSNFCESDPDEDPTCGHLVHIQELHCTETDPGCSSDVTARMENRHRIEFRGDISVWNGPHSICERFDAATIDCKTRPNATRDHTDPPAPDRFTVVAGDATFNCFVRSNVMPTQRGWTSEGHTLCDNPPGHVGVTLKYDQPRLSNGDMLEGSNGCWTTCSSASHWLDFSCSDTDCSTLVTATMENRHAVTFTTTITVLERPANCWQFGPTGVACTTRPSAPREPTGPPSQNRVVAIVDGINYSCVFDSHVMSTNRGWSADGTTNCDAPMEHVGVTLRYVTPRELEGSHGCTASQADSSPCASSVHWLELRCTGMSCASVATATMQNRHKLTFPSTVSVWDGPENCSRSGEDPGASLECFTSPSSTREADLRPLSNVVRLRTENGYSYDCGFSSGVIPETGRWRASGSTLCDSDSGAGVSDLGITLKYVLPDAKTQTVTEGWNGCTGCNFVDHQLTCSFDDCTVGTMWNWHSMVFSSNIVAGTFDGPEECEQVSLNSILCQTEPIGPDPSMIPKFSGDGTMVEAPNVVSVTTDTGETFNCFFGAVILPEYTVIGSPPEPLIKVPSDPTGWLAKGATGSYPELGSDFGCDRNVSYLSISFQFENEWRGDSGWGVAEVWGSRGPRTDCEDCRSVEGQLGHWCADYGDCPSQIKARAYHFLQFPGEITSWTMSRYCQLPQSYFSVGVVDTIICTSPLYGAVGAEKDMVPEPTDPTLSVITAHGAINCRIGSSLRTAEIGWTSAVSTSCDWPLLHIGMSMHVSIDSGTVQENGKECYACDFHRFHVDYECTGECSAELTSFHNMDFPSEIISWSGPPECWRSSRLEIRCITHHSSANPSSTVDEAWVVYDNAMDEIDKTNDDVGDLWAYGHIVSCAYGSTATATDAGWETWGTTRCDKPGDGRNSGGYVGLHLKYLAPYLEGSLNGSNYFESGNVEDQLSLECDECASPSMSNLHIIRVGHPEKLYPDNIVAWWGPDDCWQYDSRTIHCLTDPSLAGASGGTVVIVAVSGHSEEDEFRLVPWERPF